MQRTTTTVDKRWQQLQIHSTAEELSWQTTKKKKGFPHSRSWGQVHGCDHLVICLGWISAASPADNPSVSKFSLNEALWSDGCDNHNAKQTQITVQ